MSFTSTRPPRMIAFGVRTVPTRSFEASPAVTLQVPCGSGESISRTTSIGLFGLLSSHPSPLVWLPSSHSSPASTTPLPHDGLFSFLHAEEQPSPLIVLPSSHCSPESTEPLPHVDGPSFWQVAEQPS